ncbi:hypothetical protein ACIG54_11565 [Streptomyces achromogenes]|uniref:hypothetical protein n=1 Tax=Streptomyces achromogenes TaxID=67255 RepID=UPI0037D3305C
MTSDRGAQTALHLLLVWALMTGAMPVLGFALMVTAWSDGNGALVPVLALGVPLAVVLLSVAGAPVRTVVPPCASAPRRLGWATLVFVLGTLGVLAGLAVYDDGVYLGSASTRVALTGAPYAVAAAFFVPDRWVRLGATAALAAAVAYGGFIGPEQARQRRHTAEVARYREHQELLYTIDTPPGMRVARAQAGPASFTVEYHSTRFDGYVALDVRKPLTPRPSCPTPPEKDVTCAVDRRGDMRVVQAFPGGGHHITLTRRHGAVEAEVTSKTLDEPALRHLLDTLHPLSDAELESLMEEKVIARAIGQTALTIPPSMT